MVLTTELYSCCHIEESEASLSLLSLPVCVGGVCLNGVEVIRGTQCMGS